jgi:regulatory protein
MEEAGVQVGQVLSPSQVEDLIRADHGHRCFDIASVYLSYRPRSERELRTRLRRRGFSPEIVQGVVHQLKERGLVDDIAFAEFWRDNRESFSPRSRHLLRLELRQKGVEGETIEQVLQGLDDEASAYQAASKRARSLTPKDYQGFRRRLGAYLRRRGFSFGVIDHTLDRLWQELFANDEP